ncbi:unnamed protein product [Parnassius apollo]|uniref:Fatty acyl-CoA reductase n=1 Tax=Parnassius apollo TaxID=110799 RepID=A0A8S3X349_PARAO|nr:unnamed protein product [Parnassius apollo]
MFFTRRALCDINFLSVANTRKMKWCPNVRIFMRRVSSEIRSNSSTQASVVDFYAGKCVFITGGSGFLGKIFSRLKMEKPKALQKVIPIVGDVKSLNLGITQKDQDMLIEKVSVVIHSAASTIFDNSLKEALETNYEGTRNVLSLCKRLKNIQAFVHISTAYTNVDKSIIEEVVYPPPANISDVYKYLKNHGDDKNLNTKILNGRPNTYIFTKALTEDLIAKTHQSVPTVMIRPSMVGPSKDEPLKGWLDNISGNLTVYNCCTGSTNPTYLGEVFKFFNEAPIKFQDNSYGFYFRKVFIANTKLASDILTFLTQIVPAYIMDLSLFLKGGKPRFVELQKKFIPMRDKVPYFTLNTWLFKTRKTQELYSQMSEQDRYTFPFNLSDIKWPEYMHLYAKAVHQLRNNTK